MVNVSIVRGCWMVVMFAQDKVRERRVRVSHNKRRKEEIGPKHGEGLVEKPKKNHQNLLRREKIKRARHRARLPSRTIDY